jgi:HEAT repeat protein
MASPEDIKSAKDIIQALLKARKNLRLYPSNNPMYTKTVDETYRKFEEFFEFEDEFPFKITRNEIILDGDPIYQGSGKDENLALFLFRDGLRELAFKKGMDEEELREFLEILAYDYDREDVEDDVVTLMWQKEFQNISYVADDAILTEDENYEEEAVRQATEGSGEEDYLKKAYEEAAAEEDVRPAAVMPVSDKDLNDLIKDIERDAEDKKARLVDVLFDMLGEAESIEEYSDIAHILNNAVEYCIRHRDLENALKILKRAKKSQEATGNEELKKQMNLILFSAGSSKAVKAIGDLLDSEGEVNEGQLEEYVGFLERNAIPHFISLLGDLKTISARKSAINALAFLGKRDIAAVAKGLKDERWYVVRNIIYVFRKIGDSRAVDYLLKSVRHEEKRVKKEVLKTLGELGGQAAAQTIKDCFNDPDVSVRTAAAKAMGAVGSGYAKKAVLGKVTDKGFLNAEFNEKKEFFEVLSRWNDSEVTGFLMKTVKRNPLFKRAKVNELKACAAYSLGLMGNKDSLPELEKMRRSRQRLLSEYAYNAIKRIEYGK